MGRPLIPIDLAMPYFRQETDVWCWAAVSQMVIAHFRGTVATPRQKEIARMALGFEHDEHWQNGIPEEAQVANSREFIRLTVKVLSRRVSDWYPPCSAEELYALLYFGNPVILHVHVGGEQSHVVVAAGIRPGQERGTFEVLLHDPAPNIPGPFWAVYAAVHPSIIGHMIVYRDIHA
jgi:hypothetical protein